METVHQIAQRVKKAEEARQKQQLQKANQLGSQPFDLVSVLNSHALMRLPVFSTRYSRQGQRTEPIFYSSHDGSVTIEVNGNYGIPNQSDGNIIRWAISVARQIRAKTGFIPEEISTTRYNLLKTLGKSINGANYRNLEHSLKVLGGLQISGNIFSKDKEFTGTLVEFDYTRDGSGEIDKIVMTFGKNFRKHLQQEESVLSIPGQILTSINPLQIRLTEVVRSHMGRSKKWEIGLEKLMLLCAEDKRSKYEFKRVVRKTKIPYRVDFRKSSTSKEDIAVFRAG